METYPLELVHMDFLTIENPHTRADMNILVIVITDHFMWYVKAIVTPNESARGRVTAFWNEYITNNSFPEKLLMIRDVTLNLNWLKNYAY